MFRKWTYLLIVISAIVGACGTNGEDAHECKEGTVSFPTPGDCEANATLCESPFYCIAVTGVSSRCSIPCAGGSEDCPIVCTTECGDLLATCKDGICLYGGCE